MLKIGLTGGIGSGKTTVGEVFAELGVPVYVADKLGRRLMEEDAAVRASVRALFGENAYTDGALNRRYIGSIVFEDKRLLRQLNSIVHPAVHKDFQEWTLHFDDRSYVLEEAAVLFESGAAERMDYTVFVKAAEETRINRVMRRDGITREQVEARIRHQWDDERKENLADFIIYNENDSMILPQIVDLHNKFLELNG